jgi:hypothetical protein
MRRGEHRYRLALAVWLCLGCLISFQSRSSASPPTPGSPGISLVPGKLIMAPGDLCTLQVWVDDPVDSLSCLDISMSYDTAFVECVGALEGGLYTGSGTPTFFRWKHATADTVYAVDCVLGYRTYVLPPGELMKFVFRGKRLGPTHICIANVRVWDINRIPLSPVIGDCVRAVVSQPVLSFEEPELVALPDSLFRVNVLVDDPLDSLSCMDISVSFDTSLFECVKVQEGEIYKAVPKQTFFRWKVLSPGTAYAVDCVLGYRTYFLAPGELVRFLFRAKKLGEGDICFAGARLWDIDRLELRPSLGPCTHVVVRTSTGTDPMAPAASCLESFPNPFNPTTRLVLYIAGPSGRAESNAAVSIYTAAGERVRTLFRGKVPAGRHEYFWDGRNDGGTTVSAGVYFAVAEIDRETLVRKLVLLR